MAAFDTIYDTLRTRFGTLVEDVVPLPTLYDNAPSFESPENPYDPPDPRTSYWARFTVLPGTTFAPETNGELVTYRTPGVIQVQLYGPVGAGSGVLLANASTISTAFRSTCDGLVTLRTPSISPGRRDGEWWRIDVSIPFFADASA